MHCHLDLYSNPFSVAKECNNRGVYLLSVTTTPSAWGGTSKVGSGYPRIRTALGLHPQLAHSRYREIDLFESLVPKTKYIGEIGLDGGKGYLEHMERQLWVFRRVLSCVSENGGRIMSIHSRASSKIVLDELKANPNAGTPILHWFTGTKTELKLAIQMGCWFSVGPNMLTTARGKALVAAMPLDKIIPETDGPFGKYNGKQLEPWDSAMVPKLIAQARNTDVEAVQAQLYDNFRRLVS